jgi:hypothetical protein
VLHYKIATTTVNCNLGNKIAALSTFLSFKILLIHIFDFSITVRSTVSLPATKTVVAANINAFISAIASTTLPVLAPEKLSPCSLH